ncbi:TspO/MBR family protein [Flammeovirga sp. OC4]|uniref:TspO/MBR family protein n=1 Tax=Flammeovirga sp. OC4 TaxID=1382345 RepID=UPI0005C68607|nr:TspO/MBR family protein [Flammeovirga sp. OC4]
MWIRVIIFLVINFAGLAIGGFFTGDGVPSEWYQQMNKAPWTPPGWVFGVAWTTIMITFSIFLAKLYNKENRVVFIVLYGAQVILNISWNPVFFYYRNTLFGLIIITALTVLIYTYFLNYYKTLRWWSLLIVPYFVWINIATSLNAYVVIYN